MSEQIAWSEKEEAVAGSVFVLRLRNKTVQLINYLNYNSICALLIVNFIVSDFNIQDL